MIFFFLNHYRFCKTSIILSMFMHLTYHVPQRNSPLTFQIYPNALMFYFFKYVAFMIITITMC